MIDPEVRRLIQEEIRRQMNVILPGSSGDNSATINEDIGAMFPGSNTIPQRPVMHPFGFVSRAVHGTISVVARMGEHFGNRMTLGHRDSGRPTDLDEGESCLYSNGTYRIVVKNSQLMLGKGSTLEPLLMGTQVQQLLSSLIEELVIHTHAAPGAPPTDAANFTQMKTNYLDNGKILAEDGGRF